MFATGQLEKLNRLLDTLWERNPFYLAKWRAAGLARRRLSALADLSDFPFTTRDELLADQQTHPPLGTNLTFPLGDYKRIHRSSGTTRAPVFWADTAESWQWVMHCSLELFRLAGVRETDRLFFALNFGPSSGPWIMYEGACRLGCGCFTSGNADPEDQLFRLQEFQPDTLVAKPKHLLYLAQTAEDLGLKPSSLGVRKLITTGAPSSSVPGMREKLQAVWGASCFDRYGLTEAGSVAGECARHTGGLHVLEGEFVAEVVRSLTGEPAADGEPGELILTSLGRVARPIIRYRTGDLVRLVRRHRCCCGRAEALLVGGIQRKAARPQAAPREVFG
jgi:phenylacetate-CoA ligase